MHKENSEDRLDCLFCTNQSVSYILIDKKGVGSVYEPVCLNHIAGPLDWRDCNTLLMTMGLSSKIVPASAIKYPKIKSSVSTLS